VQSRPHWDSRGTARWIARAPSLSASHTSTPWWPCDGHKRFEAVCPCLDIGQRTAWEVLNEAGRRAATCPITRSWARGGQDQWTGRKERAGRVQTCPSPSLHTHGVTDPGSFLGLPYWNRLIRSDPRGGCIILEVSPGPLIGAKAAIFQDVISL